MTDQSDEQAIRAVVDRWIRATAEGDIEGVLSLMAEDVVFLSPGQEPMRGRDTFAAASRSMQGKVQFEARPEVQEVHVAGDLAFCWTYMSVTVKPLPDGEIMRRAGHILSVFRREPDGRWVLFRDANLLSATNQGRGA
jgi:uncharacterized protein (TIGR02246 family)